MCLSCDHCPGRYTYHYIRPAFHTWGLEYAHGISVQYCNDLLLSFHLFLLCSGSDPKKQPQLCFSLVHSVFLVHHCSSRDYGFGISSGSLKPAERIFCRNLQPIISVGFPASCHSVSVYFLILLYRDSVPEKP